MSPCTGKPGPDIEQPEDRHQEREDAEREFGRRLGQQRRVVRGSEPAKEVADRLLERAHELTEGQQDHPEHEDAQAHPGVRMPIEQGDADEGRRQRRDPRQDVLDRGSDIPGDD